MAAEMANSEKLAVQIDPSQHGLKQYEMKTSTVVFMIFCLTAAGAYGIEEMIPKAGPGLTLVMLMVIPFLWSTPMGLVAAELGSALPQEGGYYKWVQRACGEFWGFQAGWWRTISVYFDNTIYVVLAGSYLGSVLHLTTIQEYLFKACVIIAFTYINIRGIRDVGFVSTLISILVLVAFTGVAAVGFAQWQTNPFVPFIPPGQSLLQSIGYGIAIGMWVYSGYESMSTVAGEMKDPQIIPKATLMTVPLIMAVYILPTMGGLASLGRWSEWASEGGLTYGDVVTQVAPALGVFFVFVAIAAQFSIFNTYIASGSRGFFALAEDNLAPRILVKCSQKRGVPYVAVLSLGIFSLIICMFPFGVIVVVDVFLFMSAYALIFISACILRIREGELPRPFKVPVGTKVFIAMCIPSLIMVFIAFFINGTDYFVGGMTALVSGPIMYYIFKTRYGGLTKIDPVNHPLNPKTGLAIGDTKRMAWMFGIMTFVGILASFFLPWYENPAIYARKYAVEGLFEFMITSIRWITVASGATTLILAVAARRVEPEYAGASASE
ncbi:MAG: APC family permease [Deltaproteobacteria bacterium]|nr:APC family permease [Deltaproteobacteria bacterium]